MQPLTAVACHDELHGGEELQDLAVFLVADILSDGIGDTDGVFLQLQYAQCDAVDIDHEVGAAVPGIFNIPSHRDLLGNGEVVALRMLPVDIIDLSAEVRVLLMRLGGVAQVVVDGFVDLVQVGIVGTDGVVGQLAVSFLGLLQRAVLRPVDQKLHQVAMAHVIVLLLLQVTDIPVAMYVVE